MESETQKPWSRFSKTLPTKQKCLSRTTSVPRSSTTLIPRKEKNYSRAKMNPEAAAASSDRSCSHASGSILPGGCKFVARANALRSSSWCNAAHSAEKIDDSQDPTQQKQPFA